MSRSALDQIFERVATNTARSTTRRGFLSGTARAMVGAGLGTAFFFGNQRHAFADAGCSLSTDPDDPNSCGATSDGGGTDYCANGDGNGCTTVRAGYDYYLCEVYESSEDPPPPSPNCPEGMTTEGVWICCCNGRRSRCQDCYTSTGTLCIQQYYGGSC